MGLAELWDSLKSTLHTRAKSSFMGSFVLAWMAFQWKPLYVTFFMDEPPSHPVKEFLCYPDKLSYIASLGYTKETLLYYPLAAAAAVPFLSYQADQALRWVNDFGAQLWLRLRRKFFKEELVPRREKDELQTRFDTLKDERDNYQANLRDMTSERDSHKIELTKARLGATNLQEEKDKLQDEKDAAESKLKEQSELAKLREKKLQKLEAANPVLEQTANNLRRALNERTELMTGFDAAFSVSLIDLGQALHNLHGVARDDGRGTWTVPSDTVTKFMGILNQVNATLTEYHERVQLLGVVQGGPPSLTADAPGDLKK